MANMTTMHVRTALKVVPTLPANISVLFRGNHGIGKSQIARQIAAIVKKAEGHKNFPVIDRRLSQCTEGDLLGLPSTDGGTTRWNPPDWYKKACDEPCFLFLDELNRATPEVMQAAFQIVLDRELNGWRLHEQTRVFTAINFSGNYNVNEIDPALLDRFWTIDIAPDAQDWLAWARTDGKIAPSVIDFILNNDKWLDPVSTDPGSVQPSRRSWERLSVALTRVGIADAPTDESFYPMCLGFVGTEATIAFHEHVKNNDMRVSAEEILNKFDKVENKIVRFNVDQKNAAIEKVSDFVLKQGKLTDKQGKNLAEFMKSLDKYVGEDGTVKPGTPGELRISLWTKLMTKGVDEIDLARVVHKHCAALILDVFGVPMGEAGVGVVPKIPGIFQQDADKKK